MKLLKKRVGIGLVGIRHDSCQELLSFLKFENVIIHGWCGGMAVKALDLQWHWLTTVEFHCVKALGKFLQPVAFFTK